MTTFFKQGLDVTGNVTLSGDISIGGDAYGGDSDTDSITFTADITSNILPDVSLTYDLGSTGKQWNHVYANDATLANDLTVGGVIVSSNSSTHNLGQVVINQEQISVNPGFELKLSSPANLVLEPTDNIWISQGTKLIFEGTAPDEFEAKLQATSVTADRDIVLPDASGTLALKSFVTDYVSGTGNTLGDWTISETSGTLYFAHNGVNKMSLDSSGNLITVGDITAFGTIV